MPWQVELATALSARAAELPAVRSLRIFGSVGTGDLDRWSDVDVELTLDSPLTLGDLVPELEVWAYEEHTEADQVLRCFGADGRRLDLVVQGDRVIDLPQVDPVVNEVRFQLALAAVKLARGDRLIATHLMLDVARTVLVEAMLLRDRDEGTTAHRFGTARDELAAEILAAIAPPASHVTLMTLAAWFDAVHGERDRGYRPDWRGLMALEGSR